MKKVMDRIVGVAGGDAGGFVEAPHLTPQSSCPAVTLRFGGVASTMIGIILLAAG